MAKTVEGGEEPSQEKAQRIVSFYDKARRNAKVVRSHEIPWEECAQGRKKDLAKAINPVLHTLNATLHVLSPGGCSERHRHMAEELVYVLEGCGYDLHWEQPRSALGTARSDKPTRYDWQQGDTIYVPVNIDHQHVNLDVEKPARFICATSRIPDHASLDRLEDSPSATAI